MTKAEKKKYQSEILMVVHQDMEFGYQIGAISAERMREFDEECLVPGTVRECIVPRAKSAAKTARSRSKPAAKSAGAPKPVTPAYAGFKA